MVADAPSKSGSLMTVGEAAAALRISRGHVRRLARTGVLPAVRIGERGELRVRTQDLEQLLRPARETTERRA